MSNETIRIGVIGAGGNTRNKHIPGLQAIEGVKIVSVCNRSRESSQRVAEEFGIPEIHETWLDVIDADNTDAIVIGTWPYLHCRASIAAIEADKHVMCEARMARDAAEAQAMLEVSQANPHTVAQIVPSPFTLKVDKTIKRLIAEGFLGDILAIEIRAGGSFLDKDGPLHWRQNYDLSGKNIMSMGIWYEAFVRWVGEATNVMAMGKVYTKMRKDAEGNCRAVRIPEHVDIVADMACGAQAHLQISSVTGHAGGAEAFLFGSDGTLRFAGGKLYGGTREDKELAEMEIRPEDEGGWRVEEEFINAIRGEEAITHTTFEDGVKYMEFSEAVTLSIRTGEAIPLPLME